MVGDSVDLARRHQVGQGAPREVVDSDVLLAEPAHEFDAMDDKHAADPIHGRRTDSPRSPCGPELRVKQCLIGPGRLVRGQEFVVVADAV